MKSTIAKIAFPFLIVTIFLFGLFLGKAGMRISLAEEIGGNNKETQLFDGQTAKNVDNINYGLAYRNKSRHDLEELSVSQKALKWIKVVVPLWPGLTLLFLCSTFFSTINFFGDLTKAESPFRIISRYLVWWILINYAFSLIFLFLILPESAMLSDINTNVLIYCIVSTALPELSANIKLQMGSSERNSLDLQKYKIKITTTIDSMIGQAMEREKARNRLFLEHFYEDSFDDFKRQFVIFLGKYTSDQNIKNKFMDLLDSSEANILSAILSEVAMNPEMLNGLLLAFRNDIKNFHDFPEWRLMDLFGGRLNYYRVRKLIACNIMCKKDISRHKKKDSDFKALSQETGIASETLSSAYYTMKIQIRSRWKRRLKLLTAGGSLVIVLLFGFYTQIKQTQPSSLTEEFYETAKDPNLEKKL